MDKIPLCTCGGQGKHHQRDCAVAAWCRQGLPSGPCPECGQEISAHASTRYRNTED